jgi:hypothetical protein
MAPKHEFVELRPAEVIQADNLAINIGIVTFQMVCDGSGQITEGFVFVPTARHEPAMSVFDIRQSPEAIVLDFENPVFIVERLDSTRQAHRMKCGHPAHDGDYTCGLNG